jgi:glycine/D-amino acid oxidase-like deaminating enzyme
MCIEASGVAGMSISTFGAHVCVIGAGAMGCSATFHLAELGIDTVLVDRGSPGGEASGATAGTLTLQNKPHGIIPFIQEAMDLWDGLSARLEMDVEYEKRGGFRVAHTEEDILRLEAAVERERIFGLPIEMVGLEELRREAPYLGHGITAASFCARDGMANPFATIRGFLRAAKRRGAKVWSSAEVTKIETLGNGEFSVETSRGTIRCDAVIAAAGAWNAIIAKMVDVHLPVTTAILQVTITEAGPFAFQHIVSHVRENLTLKQQHATGKILIGGGWRGDGDISNHTRRIRRESLIGNLKWAAEVIPAIADTRVLRSWVGYEGRTPDKLLILGPVGPPGFYVLGCSYSGFSLSPISGQIIAEYIASGKTTTASDWFDVKRFVPAGIEPNLLHKPTDP